MYAYVQTLGFIFGALLQKRLMTDWKFGDSSDHESDGRENNDLTECCSNNSLQLSGPKEGKSYKHSSSLAGVCGSKFIENWNPDISNTPPTMSSKMRNKNVKEISSKKRKILQVQHKKKKKKVSQFGAAGEEEKETQCGQLPFISMEGKERKTEKRTLTQNLPQCDYDQKKKNAKRKERFERTKQKFRNFPKTSEDLRSVVFDFLNDIQGEDKAIVYAYSKELIKEINHLKLQDPIATEIKTVLQKLSCGPSKGHHDRDEIICHDDAFVI
ncbi:hypothetical protein RFI_19806 [Reticulomyxa filosa]|uniref:Uncharacterized protein n=1 Tax=Reticulomyxa filosa TaxID=46433 RepID=X6MWQ1_RETFI|nr:hypothetical protein RFI_19806 [Reticulomyxa filosa]|eukprot:ETO17515.1 hypothetical protein RFI_19806 [Reticulomyxa filosa]